MTTQSTLTPEELAKLEVLGGLNKEDNSSAAKEKEKEKEEEKNEEEENEEGIEINKKQEEVEKEKEQEEEEQQEITVLEQIAEKIGFELPEDFNKEDSIENIVEIINKVVEKERILMMPSDSNSILSITLNEEDVDGTKEFLKEYYVFKSLEGKSNVTDKDRERAVKSANVFITDLEEDGELFSHADELLQGLKTEEIRKKQSQIKEINNKVQTIIEEGKLSDDFFINVNHKKDFTSYIQTPVKNGKSLASLKRESLSLSENLKIDYFLYLESKGLLKDLFKDQSKKVKTLADLKTGGENKFKDAGKTKNVNSTEEAIKILKSYYN